MSIKTNPDYSPTWGTHLCEFYKSVEELTERLIPYFQQGLQQREKIVWVLPSTLEIVSVFQRLHQKAQDFDAFIASGQLEILTSAQFYQANGHFETSLGIEKIIARHDHALQQGYTGLSFVSDVGWIHENYGEVVYSYEKSLSHSLANLKASIICTYPERGCDAAAIVNLIHQHPPAGAKNGSRWELVDFTLEKNALIDREIVFKALDSAANGILITNQQGAILYANAAINQMTGYSPEELRNLNPRIFKSGVQDRQFYEQLWETISRGEVWQGEMVNRRKDGSLYTEELTITPVCNRDGEIIHFVAIKQDKTAEKQAEVLALRQSQQAEKILALSRDLRSALDRAAILQVIVASVTALMDADGCVVALADPWSGESELALASGVWANAVGVRIPPGEGISGVILKTGETYLSPDIRQDKRLFYGEQLVGIHNVIGVPLRAHDQTIGVLWADRSSADDLQPRAQYGADDVRLLETIGEITGNAIHRANLHEQLHTYAQQLARVNLLGQKVTKTYDEILIYSYLGEAILEIMPHIAEVEIFRPLSASWQRVFPAAQNGSRVDFESRLPEMAEIFSQVLEQRKLIIDAVPAPSAPEPSGGAGSASRLSLPIAINGNGFGVLTVQGKPRRQFSSDEQNVLSLAANTAATALENAVLFSHTKRQLRRQEAIHTVDAAINSSLDLQIIFNILIRQAVDELGVDAAILTTRNLHTGKMKIGASLGFRHSLLDIEHCHLGECDSGLDSASQNEIYLESAITNRPPSSCRIIKKEEGFVASYTAPMQAKGQIKGLLTVLHRSPLELDQERMNFLKLLAGQAAIAIDNIGLFNELQHSNTELLQAYDSTLVGWVKTLELRDNETELHSRRVTEMTVRLARAIGFPESELIHIRRGALLHDIGKMGVPDHILHKPGPLTEAEWELMRMHPVWASQLLAPIGYLKPALDIPRFHHEKWDGSGYPQGLKEQQIPLAARLFSIVDVWDALLSDRPYRAAWSLERVIDYLRSESGKHFDPDVVQAFLALLEQDHPAKPLLLIVDSDPSAEEKIPQGLQELLHIKSCASGEDALNLAEQESVDIVLVDTELPGVSWTELLKGLQRANPDIAAILTSSQPDASILMAALNISCVTGYLLKPWQVAELQTRLNFAIQKYSAAATP